MPGNAGPSTPAPAPSDGAKEKDDAAADASPGRPTRAAARWEAADKALRESAKWIITTATAFAAIVFASGGIIARGEFSEQYFWQRALVMVFAGAATAFGLAAMIGLIARSITPAEPSLDSLDAATLDQMKAHPRSYFPGEIADLEQFRKRYAFWQKQAIELRLAADEKAVALEAVKAEGTPAGSELDLLVKQLAGLVKAAGTAAANRDQYQDAADSILSQERYRTARSSFVNGGWPLVGAGVLFVVGATVYLIAASFSPTEPKSEAAASRPVLATLVAGPGSAGDALWDAANLDECETDDGEVPVLLESGDGSTAAPWTVKTLPDGEDCDEVRFNVIGEVGTVVVPEDEITIVYETTTTVVDDE